MRPAQSRLPRRSNWSNPKTCNYFAAFFPFREWGAQRPRLGDDFAMLAAPSPPVLDRAGEQLPGTHPNGFAMRFYRSADFDIAWRDIPPQRPHADSNTDKRWGLTVAEAGRVLSVLMRPVVQEPRAVDRQHGAFFLQGQIVRWSGFADVST